MANWDCFDWFCECVPSETAAQEFPGTVCTEDSLLFAGREYGYEADELDLDDALGHADGAHPLCVCDVGPSFADGAAQCHCPSCTWVGEVERDEDDEYDTVWSKYNPADLRQTSACFCEVGFTLKCTTMLTAPTTITDHHKRPRVQQGLPPEFRQPDFESHRGDHAEEYRRPVATVMTTGRLSPVRPARVSPGRVFSRHL